MLVPVVKLNKNHGLVINVFVEDKTRKQSDYRGRKVRTKKQWIYIFPSMSKTSKSIEGLTASESLNILSAKT